MSSLMQLLATKINDEDCLVFLKADLLDSSWFLPIWIEILMFLTCFSHDLVLLKCDHTHKSQLHITKPKGLKSCYYEKGGWERMINFITISPDFVSHHQVFRTQFLFKIFVIALLVYVIHISSSIPYEIINFTLSR